MGEDGDAGGDGDMDWDSNGDVDVDASGQGGPGCWDVEGLCYTEKQQDSSAGNLWLMSAWSWEQPCLEGLVWHVSAVSSCLLQPSGHSGAGWRTGQTRLLSCWEGPAASCSLTTGLFPAWFHLTHSSLQPLQAANLTRLPESRPKCCLKRLQHSET